MIKPAWLKVRSPINDGYKEIDNLVQRLNVHTVCQEAACPNIGECWGKRQVTVMILGAICTRTCKYCNIKLGKPNSVDVYEPQNLATLVINLKLKHIVITSVTRDDLPDGGARHFALCINAIRNESLSTTIEVLTPDFLNKKNALEIVVEAKPDIYNHNIETVPSLYAQLRAGASYVYSVNLLNKVKTINPKIFTKSGIMLGLGETQGEVEQVICDLFNAGVDFLTIGQYLQPTSEHVSIASYILPEQFKYYKLFAEKKGFKNVASGPLIRSSYLAMENFSNYLQS